MVSCPSHVPVRLKVPLTGSDRDAYKECPILYPLQLRKQNYTSYSVEMYEIQVLAITRKGD